MPERSTVARITSVHFQNFKALRDFTIRLTDTNFLVGPNNAGKSTIIGAFRVLAVALRKMSHSKLEIVNGPDGRSYGTGISSESLPISLENVHTDYADQDTTVSFRISNGNELKLFFPRDGGCILLADAASTRLGSTAAFRTAFPIELAVIPVLGPVEHAEALVLEETVEKNITTHRASRNFRSYWYHNQDHFEAFANGVARTWQGMEIQKPVLANYATRELVMFCNEDRIPRELFWIGSGFQIWCQLLTHLMRVRNSSLVIIDEPEVYLHADMQRQLVGFLRKFEADILLATHSTEIMGEADPSELVLIDKRNRSAERLKNAEKLQMALAAVGSIHNISLSRLARSRRIVFFEGDRDFKLVRLFARHLGFDGIASGLDIFPAKSEGFGSWQKVSNLGWGIGKALDNELAVGAVYDRDYFPDSQIEAVEIALNEGLSFSHIHNRKEIENYLLIPDALDRALSSAIKDKAKRDEKDAPKFESVTPFLMQITDNYRVDVLSQRTGREVEFRKTEGGKLHPTTLHSEAIKRFEETWKTLEGRLTIVPGKAVLGELREMLSNLYGISLTDSKIISVYGKSEVPSDFLELLEKIETFRLAPVKRL